MLPEGTLDYKYNLELVNSVFLTSFLFFSSQILSFPGKLWSQEDNSGSTRKILYKGVLLGAGRREHYESGTSQARLFLSQAKSKLESYELASMTWTWPDTEVIWPDFY